MDSDGGNVTRVTRSVGGDGHGAWTPDGKEILFTGKRDGNQDVYSVQPDGSNVRRLTDAPAADGAGEVSPDGLKIAFYSERDGDGDIYVMNRDGSNLKNLTNDKATQYELSWSPDSRRIAYYSDAPDPVGKRFELFVVDADGKNPRQLTNSAYDNAFPTWSPDESRIAFASTRDGDWEIYTMASDGSDLRRLTSSPGRDAHPAYLPDGKTILFQSPRDHSEAGQVDLWSMDADGANQKRLLAAPGFNGVPNPSPDGKRFTFQRGTVEGETYHWELYLVNADGGGLKQLTSNAWSSQVPTWSPDGKRIVFYANPDGRDQLFAMDVAGGAAHALPPQPGGRPDAVLFARWALGGLRVLARRRTRHLHPRCLERNREARHPGHFRLGAADLVEGRAPSPLLGGEGRDPRCLCHRGGRNGSRPADEGERGEAVRGQPATSGPGRRSRRRPFPRSCRRLSRSPRPAAGLAGSGVQVMRFLTVPPLPSGVSPSSTIFGPWRPPTRKRTLPLSSTQVCVQRFRAASHMFRLVPVRPLAPFHSSRTAQPPRSGVMRLTPARLARLRARSTRRARSRTGGTRERSRDSGAPPPASWAATA